MGSESWIQAQCGHITEDQYWSDIQNQLGLDKRSLRNLRDDFYGGDRAKRGRDRGYWGGSAHITSKLS